VFEAMIKAWEKQQLSYPETAHIVQEGIYKLESYRERVQDVPAYILSMREFSILYYVVAHWTSSYKSGSQATLV
jgi:hypothetical protein